MGGLGQGVGLGSGVRIREVRVRGVTIKGVRVGYAFMMIYIRFMRNQA
jgi:hypothetical protein